MTIATRLTCDWHEGCAAERAPYAESGPASWSHFAVRTTNDVGIAASGRGSFIEVDLCPAHAIAVREMFGSPR